MVQGEMERARESQREAAVKLESVSSQLREREQQCQLMSATAEKVSTELSLVTIQGTKLGVILRWPHWPLTDSCRLPIQILSCHIIVCICTLIYIEALHACVNSMLLFYTLHLNTVKPRLSNLRCL